MASEAGMITTPRKCPRSTDILLCIFVRSASSTIIMMVDFTLLNLHLRSIIYAVGTYYSYILSND